MKCSLLLDLRLITEGGGGGRSRTIAITMKSWFSYRALWPVFGVLAVISWITVAFRPNGYLVLGAVALTATAVIASLRGRHEAQTTQR